MASGERSKLKRVKPELARQGHAPTGPHTAHPGGQQYLELGDGRRVTYGRDREGRWGLLVYTPIGSGPPPIVWLLRLTSTAAPDGRDFPGEAV